MSGFDMRNWYRQTAKATILLRGNGNSNSVNRFGDAMWCTTCAGNPLAGNHLCAECSPNGKPTTEVVVIWGQSDMLATASMLPWVPPLSVQRFRARLDHPRYATYPRRYSRAKRKRLRAKATRRWNATFGWLFGTTREVGAR